MTTGDKIRSTTDEQLACILYSIIFEYTRAFITKNRLLMRGELRMPSEEERIATIRKLFDELREEYEND